MNFFKCFKYFILVLVILIGMGVGTYFVLSGNVDALKQPFLQSLETYNPDDSSGPAKALVDVWDDFQSDVSSGGNWAVTGGQKDRLLFLIHLTVF